MGFDPRRAQRAGFDVAEVGRDLAKHLLAEQRRLRENPKLAEKGNERLNIAVSQKGTATGVHWASLGGLPEGIPEIKVSANSFEAARNKMSVTALLEQRFRRRLAEEMQRTGMYDVRTLEGRRAAMARAIDASVSVADFDFAAN